MKVIIAGAVLLGLATALAGCGGSDSKTSTTPAASVAAPTKAAGTTPGATTAVGATPSAAAPTSAAASTSSSGGGDTCKYLSASEATALVANAGAVKVTAVDAAAAKQTSCTWGNLRPGSDGISLIVNEFKISAAVNAIKTKMDSELVEKVDGLGDKGGFQTKGADGVTVTFIKGSTQVALIVNTTGVNADAVLAAAKKIAAGL